MIRISRQRDVLSPVEHTTAEWGATTDELAPDWPDLLCARNGGEHPRELWDRPLADGDHVCFYTRPGIIPVPFSAAVVTFLNTVGVSIAFSIISRLLLPSRKPNKPDEADSSTHSFRNLRSNERLEGTPMPVPYGRHRMAPPIINQVVRTTIDGEGNPISNVFLLMLLSDGQVQAIGDKTADGGPFRAEDGTHVRGLQINNQPAENFENVEAHVRLGTAEQETIPGFSQPALQYGVGSTLRFPVTRHKSPFAITGVASFSGGTGYTNGATLTVSGGTFTTAATFIVTAPAGVPTALTLVGGGSYTVAPPSPASVTGGGGSGLTLVPTFDSLLSAVGDSASDPTAGTNTVGSNTAIATAGRFADTSVNVTKWDLHASYTMGDSADEFAAIMAIPQGLGDFRSTSPATNTVVYQIRYRRVDDVGVPFGDFIVLDAERIGLARQGAFELETRRRFYTPDVTYAPPAFGLFLRGRTGTTGTTNRGASCTVDVTKVPSRPKADTDFSFACWIRPNGSLPLSSGQRRIFQWSGTNVGIRCSVRTGTLSGQAHIDITLGTGSAEASYSFSDLQNYATLVQDSGAQMQFSHFVLTYDGDGGGSTAGKIRVYVNGSLRYTLNSVQQMQFDPAQTVRVQSDAASPTAGFNCDMDEPTFWSKTLSAYDIARLYNQKAPLTVSDTAEGLIVGGRFDSGTTTSPCFGPAALGNWTLGDGAGGATPNVNPEISNQPTSENGIVKTAESGTPLRGKFRIDVMRINVEDSEVGLVSELQWSTVELVTYQDYCYPGCGLLAVSAQATDQLGGSEVLVTTLVDGRLVPVWDGVDPVYPNMVPTWSRNPAWIAADVATNPDYGLGNVYTARDLDVAAFQELADYCDELIYDNLTRLVIVTARQIEAADNANLPTALEGGSQDFVRYETSTLAPNWPQPTSGLVNSGKYLKPKVTGTPSPSVPAWLTTEAGATAQEIRYVEHTGSVYYVWCNSSAAVGATSALYTPTPSSTNYVEVEVHDVRYRYDGIFDRQDVPAWDALTQVLQVARAVPMRIGRRLSVFVDKPGSPVALITMGNIIEGTFKTSAQGITERPNVEQAEFFDEDLNYERSFVTDELPTVTDPGTQSAFNFRRIRTEGVTRRGQAKRALRRDLNAFNLLREMVEFELGLGALPLMPGDIADVAHDVPGLGFSGRVWESAADGTTVKLDRSVTIEAAKSYQVRVENAASDVRETKPITTGAGTYAAGTALAVGGGGFSFSADESDVYTFGEVGLDKAQYRIVDSRFDPTTMRRKIKMIQYNPDVYGDDFGTLELASPTTLPTPSAPTIPSGVENLVVSERVSRGPDGSVRISADVSFTHPAETYGSVAGADVYLTRGTHEAGRGAGWLVASLDRRAVSCLIEHPFERDVTYTVWVVPRSVTGSTYRMFATHAQFVPSGLATPPRAPTNVRASISGELVVYQWDDPGDLDHSTIVEGRIGGWLLGRTVFVAPAAARSATPAFDWSGAPANALGVGTPDLIVRAKIGTGQTSEAARLAFAPALPNASSTVLELSDEDSW